MFDSPEPDPLVDTLEIITLHNAVERWKMRALSAERIWASVAYALGMKEEIRKSDRVGLQNLVAAHTELLAREWLADPHTPANRQREMDIQGGHVDDQS